MRARPRRRVALERVTVDDCAVSGFLIFEPSRAVVANARVAVDDDAASRRRESSRRRRVGVATDADD
jgi:hypothetical protein